MIQSIETDKEGKLTMKPLILLLIAVFMTALAHAQFPLGPKAGSIPGGVSVTTDTFPTASFPAHVQQGQRYRLHAPVPLLPPPQGKFPAAGKASLFVEDSHAGLADPVTEPLIGRNFAGITDQGIWPPPDPIIAAGTNHIMACVNTRFRIWDKEGTVLKTIETADWYRSLLPPRDWFIFDPKIRFDHFANRWIMVWLFDDGTPTTWGDTSYFAVSVSDDDNPLGVWHNWAIPSNVNGDSSVANGADYEGVGFDENAIYISSNQFHVPEGTYQYVKVRILEKNQFYLNNPGPITWTDFWDFRDPSNETIPVITIRPMISFSSSGEYFLLNTAPFNPASYYTLWKISDPLNNPSVLGVNMPAAQYRLSPNALQLGGGTAVNNNGRLRNEPVYRDSSLWVVHAVASGPSNANSSLRYLRINPFAETVTEDVTFGQDGYWYIYPALMVDENKNLAITYSRSSSAEYIGAFVCGRNDADPPGLSASVSLKPGEANFVRLNGYGVNSWGDYMGMALDPVDRDMIWAFTEYAASPGNTWGTWVGQVILPVSTPILSDSSIDFGTLETGETKTDSVIVTNRRGDSLDVYSVSTDLPGQYSIAPDSAEIAPLASRKFYITFTASAPGAYAGHVYLNHGAVGSPAVIQVTGTLDRPHVHLNLASYWNMVSVPLQVDHYRMDSVFPGAISRAWTFNRKYYTEDTLDPGVGYWLKYAGTSALKISGSFVSADTFDVRQNWNMIGSISYPVPVSTIAVLPPELTATGFYHYGTNGKYQVSDTIKPGYGYWVKTNQSGQLILNAPATVRPVNGIRIVPASELPPPPPGEPQDLNPGSAMPSDFALGQNYTDPFNPTTTISYQLPAQSRVTLKIFDVLGREVATLVDGIQEPGYKTASFNAGKLASGVYYYRLHVRQTDGGSSTRSYVDTKKLLLLK